MRLWLPFVCTLLLGAPSLASATRTSYHIAHPAGWMHQLPVGESPGWSAPSWINLELNHANIWNKGFDMVDRKDGRTYTYRADFEQSSAIVDFGFALDEDVALAFEVPYANRNGGFLDDFIDQFHQLIQSSRFLREHSKPFGNDFGVETDGASSLASKHGEGVASAKLKLKWWLWQATSLTPGACDCGLSLSGHVKLPALPRKTGLSSGTPDYTLMANFGLPIGDYSGWWFTAAVTRLGSNDTFPGWPMKRWTYMYELTLDLALTPRFGLLLQARAESPLMNRDRVDFRYTETESRAMRAERIASGWNSLMYWRGSQAFGFRWLWPEGTLLDFLMVEDWGIGNQDSRGDWLYVNNAPDVAFLTQMHFTF